MLCNRARFAPFVRFESRKEGRIMQRKPSGFTLIEIAIVLVIVGLLLGGVLKGQELITGARAQPDVAAGWHPGRVLRLALRERR